MFQVGLRLVVVSGVVCGRGRFGLDWFVCEVLVRAGDAGSYSALDKVQVVKPGRTRGFGDLWRVDLSQDVVPVRGTRARRANLNVVAGYGRLAVFNGLVV